MLSTIYAWMTEGATAESLQKFDQALYEPDVDAELGANAPGWSDEETFESFESFTATMGSSRSVLGAVN
jgi:hypothetical protein